MSKYWLFNAKFPIVQMKMLTLIINNTARRSALFILLSRFRKICSVVNSSLLRWSMMRLMMKNKNQNKTIEPLPDLT